MSKNDILYVKGMNMADIECLDNDNDMWDDTQLTIAYDKALSMANIEVAKRIAMATNTSKQSNSTKTQVNEISGKLKIPTVKADIVSSTQIVKDEKTQQQIKLAQSLNKLLRTKNLKRLQGKSSPQSIKLKSVKKKKWEEGEPCRAVYVVDGQEYEAFVYRIINNKECVVKFVGYENSELVALDDLKPSHGKEAQNRQIEQSVIDEESDCSMELGSDRILSPESVASRKKNKKKNKNKRDVLVNGIKLPDMMSMPIPLPMHSTANMKHFSEMEMPLAPPPAPFPAGSEQIQGEQQAVSSMLLSWYMSGYYTGLYQGMKNKSKDHKRRKD